jgi:hypothetical protein
MAVKDDATGWPAVAGTTKAGSSVTGNMAVPGKQALECEWQPWLVDGWSKRLPVELHSDDLHSVAAVSAP